MRRPAVHLTEKTLREWYRVDARLLDIVSLALQVWPWDVCRVTSIARLPSEDRALGGSGIHAAGPPWRAVDLAGPRGEPWDPYERAAAEINTKWVYDPARPHLQVAVGRRHGSGPHLHLQVCAATARRG